MERPARMETRSSSLTRARLDSRLVQLKRFFCALCRLNELLWTSFEAAAIPSTPPVASATTKLLSSPHATSRQLPTYDDKADFSMCKAAERIRFPRLHTSNFETCDTSDIATASSFELPQARPHRAHIQPNGVAFQPGIGAETTFLFAILVASTLKCCWTLLTSLLIVPMRTCQALPQEQHPEQDACWSQGRRLRDRRP